MNKAMVTRLCFLFCCCVYFAAPAQGGDWANWRGPTMNGVSPEKDLPDIFTVGAAAQANVVWTAEYGCRSTPLVLNGRVYINSHTGKGIDEQERVVCLDEKSGKKVWEYKFNVFHTDIVSARVGWTNLAADPETGNIYCHGTQGLLLCFNKDGKVLWQRSLGEEFGRVSGYGGRLASPLVDEDKVIIGMANAAWGEYGRGGCRFIAFDKKNGQIVWWGSTVMRVKDTFQSTPVIAVIDGERLMISGGADGGVHAFRARTGEKVWSLPIAGGAVNPAPVVHGSKVFIAHGEVNEDVGQQGRVLCLDAAKVKDGKPEVVWKQDGIKFKFSSPVLHEGRLYYVDEGAQMYCLDAETGNEIWNFKYGRGSNVRCSPVLADGKIYVGDSSGAFYILEPGKTRCKRLHRENLTSATPGVDAELDGAAAVANGRVFFATNDTLICIGKPEHNTPADKVPAPAKEKPDANAKPAFLQVYPADVTLAPGESASFEARLYDARGNFLKKVQADWSLGPTLLPETVPGLPPVPPASPPALKGTLSEDGKFMAPMDVQGQFGNVVAKAEGLTGRARVRQTPKLPYKQDFEKVPQGAVPGGWVNSQVKFQVRKVGDGNVLVKTATNPSPLVARANAFFGPPGMKNYTIEADMLAKKSRGEIPDMAVVNSRYTFGLFGNNQQLRLISWDALPRIDKSVAFTWKEDVWYRAKLTVEYTGDKAVVRGKVWERAKEEPAKWTLEVEDPMPNREGAPALYANVVGIPQGGVGAEVFFDNLVVTPHKGENQGKVVEPKKDGAVVQGKVIEFERVEPMRRRLLRWRAR